MASMNVSTPSSQRINVTGGVKPQSGQSAAARMVKERRERGRRYTLRTRSQGRQRRGGGAPSQPYDALESPFKTQAQFNQAVARNAKSMYQPELDTLGGEEGSEQALHAQHQGSNVQIFNQMSQQATNALEQGRTAMAEIAARQNASTQTGQQALQAALSNTGVSGLAGVTNPQEFTAAASGLGNAGSQVLAGEQTGLTGELAKNLSVPGAGLQQATTEENQRSQGIMRKIGAERKGVLARVPDLLSKARTDLSKQEQERQANKLQAGIAKGKLGLEKTTQRQNYALGKGQLAQKREEAKEQAALKYKELEQQAGFNAAQLEVEREKLWAAVDEAKGAKKKAAAELAGKRFDRGVDLMNQYFTAKNNKRAEEEKNAGATTPEAKAKIPRTSSDPTHLYNTLTQQANLTAPEAFRLMKSSGDPEVVNFANVHLRAYEGATQHTGRGVTGWAPGKKPAKKK